MKRSTFSQKKISLSQFRVCFSRTTYYASHWNLISFYKYELPKVKINESWDFFASRTSYFYLPLLKCVKPATNLMERVIYKFDVDIPVRHFSWYLHLRNPRIRALHVVYLRYKQFTFLFGLAWKFCFVLLIFFIHFTDCLLWFLEGFISKIRLPLE